MDYNDIFDYSKLTEMIQITQDNLNRDRERFTTREEALKAYGFNPHNVFGKNYSLKDTSSYAEAVNTVSQDFINTSLTYADGALGLSAIAFDTGLNYTTNCALIGNLALTEPIENVTEMLATAMAGHFGYVIDQAIWAGGQFAGEVQFWKDLINDVFGSSHGFYILDGAGNFYLNKEAVERAYELFSELPTGEGDGIWYDNDGEELPLVFSHSILYYCQSADVLPSGVIRRDVSFVPSDPDVIMGLGKVSTGGTIGYNIAFYHKMPAAPSSSTITVTTVDLYADGTSTTTTNTMLVSIPSAGSERDIVLGGTTYRYMEYTNAVANNVFYWRSVPDGINLETLTSFPPTGLVGVTQETPALHVTEITGTPHPVPGGSMQTTYPDWYSNRKSRTINGDGEEDPNVDDVFYPFVPFSPTDITNITYGDVYNFWTFPVSLPDLTDKEPWINPDFIKDFNDKMDKDVKDRSKDNGNNPVTPTDINAGTTPLPSVVVPTDSGQDSGFMAVYHPTKTIVRTFSNWLWSVGFDLDTFKKMFLDPMSAIVSLHEVFVHPTDAGATTIQLGYIDTNISTAYVNDTSYVLDCGTIKVPEYFQNALDYEPYTSIDIFLPFIGFRSLQPSDIIGSTVKVSYTVDLITGACVADIIVEKGAFKACMYQFTGNCAIQIPISSGNFNQIISNAIGIAASGFATLATSGALAPMLIGAGANALTNSHAQVQRGGTLGGNAGALTYKKPFMVITRHKSVVPFEYQKFEGYPASTQIRLGRCEGYTRVKSCHLDGVSATEREKQEIESLLKRGVII